MVRFDTRSGRWRSAFTNRLGDTPQHGRVDHEVVDTGTIGRPVVLASCGGAQVNHVVPTDEYSVTRVGAGPHENRLVQRSEDGNVRRAPSALGRFRVGSGSGRRPQGVEASLHLGDVDKVSVIESRVGTGRSGVVDLDHHRRPFGNRRLGKGKSGQRRRTGLLLGGSADLHDGSVGIELGQDPAVRWLARDDVDRTETLDWINVEYRGWARVVGGESGCSSGAVVVVSSTTMAAPVVVVVSSTTTSSAAAPSSPPPHAPARTATTNRPVGNTIRRRSARRRQRGWLDMARHRTTGRKRERTLGLR